MSVRFKIIGLTALVLAIGIILGITGYVCSLTLTSMSDEQYLLSQKSSSVSTVLNAHFNWKQSLTEAVMYMQPFTGSLNSATCALGQWKDSDAAKGIDDTQLLSALSKIDIPHDYIHNEAATIAALIEAGDKAEAERVLKENILPKADETIKLLGDMETRYAQLLAAKGADIVSFGNTMNMVLIILIAVALVVSVLLAWLVTSSIMKPLKHMAQIGEAIAVGDLETDVSYAVNDEIGMLANAFHNIIEATKKQVEVTEALSHGDLTASISPRSDKDTMNIELGMMLDNLNEMFSGISASSSQVAAGSQDIASGAQSLALGSTQQASAVEELSVSIAEIAEKTKDNATRADRAAALANSIKQTAETGSEQMNEMMTAVQEISQASQSISKVIKVIDEIAFQTNILALNAAVEAARAGQHGRGFAVVAEEVRNLAAKSAEAASDTETLIANSIVKAEVGSRIASETANSLTEIVAGINESSALIGDIARLSGEQAEGINQINRGIEQVAQVVQQNSATAQQSAAASQEMSGQSTILGEMISRFKLRDAQNNFASRGNQGYLPSARKEAPAFESRSEAGLGKY